jgi:hypothetical protein
VQSILSLGTDLFAATYQGGVVRSTDRGASWTTANGGLPAVGALRLSTGSSRLFAALANGELYESTDQGGSWTNAQHPYSGSIHAILPVGQDLFTGTSYGEVFRRPIGGGAWMFVADGLLCTEVTALAVSGSFLLAGTAGSAVWRRPLSEIVTGADGVTSLPVSATLDQNFPNPFNPATTIGYRLPRAGEVTLTVYDLHGRAVATLVDGIEPPGWKHVTWDASGKSSGVYFYRFRVRFTGDTPGGASGQGVTEFTETKKLLLVH